MASTDVWVVYTDDAGEWHWKRTTRNGELVAASTETYKYRTDCVANASRFGYEGD